MASGLGTKDGVDLEEGDREQEGAGCGVRIAPGRRTAEGRCAWDSLSEQAME